jgi:hypothetical protein
MKKLAMLVMLVVSTAGAQTTNGPVLSTNYPPVANPPDTFLASVQNYFTSFGTNTWTGTHGYLETSALYQHNINFGNEMELGVDIKDMSTNVAVYIGAQADNALGLGGVLSSQVSVGLAYRLHDIQAKVMLNGGYDYNLKSGIGAVDFQLQKKLTQNTFAYIGFAPTYDKNSVKDYLKFGAGFTF